MALVSWYNTHGPTFHRICNSTFYLFVVEDGVPLLIGEGCGMSIDIVFETKDFNRAAGMVLCDSEGLIYYTRRFNTQPPIITFRTHEVTRIDTDDVKIHFSPEPVSSIAWSKEGF
jgi:hypothetical protein